MSIMMKPLQELPPEVHAEVRDFVEFLLAKRSSRVRTILRQNWAGALRNYRGSLGFRMVEPKSTANSANSREKNKKISAICVIRGEKFTSW
ncbi:MAG: hypothetical protein DRI37_03355, partial [Chloroflexi bacterium]